MAGLARDWGSGAVPQGRRGEDGNEGVYPSVGQRGLDAPPGALGGWREAAKGRLTHACTKFSLGLHLLEAVTSFPGRLGNSCATFADNGQTARLGVRFRDVLPLPEPPRTVLDQWLTGKAGAAAEGKAEEACVELWTVLVVRALNFEY